MPSRENHAEKPEGPASECVLSEAIVSTNLARQISTYPIVSCWGRPMVGALSHRSSPPQSKEKEAAPTRDRLLYLVPRSIAESDARSVQASPLPRGAEAPASIHPLVRSLARRAGATSQT